MTPISPITSSPGLLGLIELAKVDLSVRASIPLDQITVIDARPVVWPDASLGCPQPGMQYAQVLTPGYLVLLAAWGIQYEYHAGRGAAISYCHNPTPPVPTERQDI